MKFAVSNIALTAFDHDAELARRGALGLAGVEIAPSRVWRDTWQGLRPAEVAAYRHAIKLIEADTGLLAPMHTHEFALEEAESAIEALRDGASIHSCLLPKG